MKFDINQLSGLAQTVASLFKRWSGKIAQVDLVELLVKEESKIGGALFPGYNPNYPRTFVRIDHHRWLWREPTDSGYKEVVYTVSPQRVMKTHAGSTQEVVGQELQNLYAATKRYAQKVERLYATL